MTLEERVRKIHELKTKLSEKETAKKSLDEEIKAINTELSGLTGELLTDLDTLKQDTFELDDLVAYTAVTSSTGYTDEAAVLKYLHDNGYDAFIKITTAIKKKELNAELKTNSELKEAMKGFTSTITTRYATVSTKENNAKRLEHIAESKKGK